MHVYINPSCKHNARRDGWMERQRYYRVILGCKWNYKYRYYYVCLTNVRLLLFLKPTVSCTVALYEKTTNIYYSVFVEGFTAALRVYKL